MSNKSAINAQRRKKNLPEIKDFLDDAGLNWNYVHGFEWHIRVENAIDIFPGKKKYHALAKDIWGEFEDYDELGRIFLQNMI